MIAAIILAAGKSERMGRPKALLPFGDSTFLQHLYDLLKGSSAGEVRVVLGAQAVEIKAGINIPEQEIVINPDYEKGMLSSLQAGLVALQETAPEAVILCPVDHPNISLPLIELIISSFRSSRSEIVVPTRAGRRGHPVLFASSLFEDLLSAPLDVGARHVVHQYPEKVLEVETDEPGVVQDIDAPEDYRELTGEPPG
jgi:molybdenum cofactor cytidylyltransferase